MKNKLFLLDLALCSIWVLAILGGRHNWSAAPLLVSLAAVYFRITFSFTFNLKEKRSWIPLLGMWACSFSTLFFSGILGISDMGKLPCSFFGYWSNRNENIAIGMILVLLIWLLPVILYFIQLFRRKLVRTDLSYKNMFGAILWTDRKASNYSELMLVTIGSLYAGLTMDPRACRFVCIVAPALSYYLICSYYKVKAERLWVIIISMILFFYAQVTCNYVRVGMLAASFGFIVYVGCLLNNNMKRFFTTFMAIIYIGIFLPSLSIGYNQYTCINYARSEMIPLLPFRGVFVINDGSKQVGLRDRYGLLVPPQYDELVYFKSKNSWLGDVELRKCGDTRTYDILNGMIRRKSDIDSILQNRVYDCIKKIYDGSNLRNGERCQVIIKNLNSQKIEANLKIIMDEDMIVDYDEKPFFPNDTIQPLLRQCVYGAIHLDNYSNAKTVCYLTDVCDTTNRLSFSVKVNFSADETPKEEVIIELTNKICNLLKEDSN